MVTTSLLAFAIVSSAFAPGKPDWTIAAPIVHKNLAIYPVLDRTDDNVGGRYITLDEGLKTGVIKITEMSGGGTPLVRNRPGGSGPSGGNPRQTLNAQQTVGGATVNSLAILNSSGKMLILMAGEMVVGGKQDRIIQKDGLVPPSKEPQSLEVFCVEHGRWTATDHVAFKPTDNAITKGAGGGGAIADITVRGSAQSAGSQAKVWEEVDSKNRKSGAAPGTQTYQGTLNSEKNKRDSGDYLKAILAKFPKSGAVGAIVSINGHLIWADCFADDSIFERYRAKLLGSYVVEAITEFLPATAYDHPTAAKAKTFLADTSGTSTFEGSSNVYKLTKITGKNHLIYELSDETGKGSLPVHFNKMLKK